MIIKAPDLPSQKRQLCVGVAIAESDQHEAAQIGGITYQALAPITVRKHLCHFTLVSKFSFATITHSV
jgi:hypothetical protein